MTADPYGRMIRWFPPEWRQRYGPEMTALLEDTYATPGAMPWRARMGLLRSGLAERARVAGLYGSAPGPAEQVRAGSVLVLCGWALFLVAGAIFAKFADNWSVAAPNPARWVASDSYDAVAVLAALGCALVALAALLAVPPLARLVRDGRWETVRRPMRRAIVAGGVAVVLFGGAARMGAPPESARSKWRPCALQRPLRGRVPGCRRGRPLRHGRGSVDRPPR